MLSSGQDAIHIVGARKRSRPKKTRGWTKIYVGCRFVSQHDMRKRTTELIALVLRAPTNQSAGADRTSGHTLLASGLREAE